MNISHTEVALSALEVLLGEIRWRFLEGELTRTQLEWFLRLTAANRNAVMATAKEFALFADLGIITVPDDYAHEGRLHMFEQEVFSDLNILNRDINDEHFANPSCFMKPGQKLHVRALAQVSGEPASSDECLVFLSRLGAVYPGAQGASLVFEQKRHQLPKGRWYVSLDRKEYLWDAGSRGHGVPCIIARSEGDFDFRLTHYENRLGAQSTILCFTQVE